MNRKHSSTAGRIVAAPRPMRRHRLVALSMGGAIVVGGVLYLPTEGCTSTLQGVPAEVSVEWEEETAPAQADTTSRLVSSLSFSSGG